MAVAVEYQPKFALARTGHARAAGPAPPAADGHPRRRSPNLADDELGRSLNRALLQRAAASLAGKGGVLAAARAPQHCDDRLAATLARSVLQRARYLQRMMGSYEEWYQNYGHTLAMGETNRNRFRREYLAIDAARARLPLPGGRVLPGNGQFVLRHQGADLGTLQYALAPLDPAYVGNRISAFPALDAAVANGAPVLQIVGFHSSYEDTVKGIGSALLGQLVETADAHGCDHIVVLSGVNHPVYEAFGFRLIEPALETWWMRTSDLRSRVKQRPVRAGIPNVPRPRFRESPF